MLRVAAYFILAVTLIPRLPGPSVHADALQQPFSSSLVLGMGPPSSGEKSAADLAAKLLLLDELVSLENDVTETKKKRSFPGFGSPLDRLSTASLDLKAKQRKGRRRHASGRPLEGAFPSPQARPPPRPPPAFPPGPFAGRKVVEVPKRRFGIPLDRIGMNRLSKSRG